MKTVIIIPYRDREEHLNYFLKHSAPFIKENMNDVEILIVEQSNDKLFNRGKLLNIGVHYTNNEDTLFITHDVDVNPIALKTIDLYNLNVDENEIIGIYTSECNTLGGLIKFKGKTFNCINGFPNNFWGWGTEDKCLQNRAEFYNIKISKNIKNKDENRFEYFNIFDHAGRVRHPHEYGIHWHNEYNIFKNLSRENKEVIIKSSGLINIDYHVKDVLKINDYIKKILVDI